MRRVYLIWCAVACLCPTYQVLDTAGESAMVAQTCHRVSDRRVICCFCRLFIHLWHYSTPYHRLGSSRSLSGRQCHMADSNAGVHPLHASLHSLHMHTRQQYGTRATLAICFCHCSSLGTRSLPTLKAKSTCAMVLRWCMIICLQAKCSCA